SIRKGSWIGKRHLPVVNDDQAILSALAQLWDQVRKVYPGGLTIFRVGVTLFDLSPAGERQLDLLLNDDRTRRRWERASEAVDGLNARYAGTVVSLGYWNPPKGGHVGGKISYTRIPSAED